MAGRLNGKIAFLTAAGAGIGRETAELFAAEGAKVIATDLDKAKLAGLDADCRALDVRSTEAVNAMARDIGAINILFNCAGYVHHGTVLDCSDQDWDFSFDLNVKSMHRTIKAFLPAMLEKGGGSIINISSGVSSIRGVPNRYVYGATKAAVIGLTKAVAADFIRRGIRCNAICPGTIQSPSLDDRIATLAKSSGQPLETCARPSSTGSQSAGSARRARWPISHCILPRMRALTRRGKSISPMAALRCELDCAPPGAQICRTGNARREARIPALLRQVRFRLARHSRYRGFRRDRLDPHLGDALVVKTQRHSGRSRYIDNAAIEKRAAIAHDDEHRLVVPEIGHFHPRPEGQRAMGGGKSAELLAARGAASIIIIGGFAGP